MKTTENISSERQRKLDREKAIKNLQKGKEVEKLQIKQGKRYTRTDNRTLKLK